MKKIVFMMTALMMIPLVSFSSEEVKEKDLTQFMKDMTLTYSEVEYMSSPVKKIQESLLLGTSEKSNADFEYSKSKIRMTFSKKPRNILIIGDESFWQIMDNDVTTGSIKQQNFPNIFIDIFSKPEVWDDIKIKKVGEKDNKISVSVATKEKFPWLSELFITVDKTKRTVVNLKYVDDVQNSVEFQFKRVRFKKNSPSKNRFIYTPLKKDIVNNL